MTPQDFATYVEAGQVALRRFLTALCCGDAALADDIAQETYVKAYLSCESFSDDSKFSVWVHRIAYNTFISYRRSARIVGGIDEAASVDSGDCADGAFRYQELYMALETLSPKERTAVLLYYLDGYQVKQIAEITESTQDAVRQQLARGREHLRQRLTNQEI